MTNSTGVIQSPELDEMRGLLKALNALEGQFREQRAVLARHGMGLPRNLMASLQEVRNDMETLIKNGEETQVELRSLRELGRTTELINSTLKLDDLLNEVMDTVVDLTRAERGYLMLRNPDTGTLEFRVARNIEHRNLAQGEFIISNSIVAKVAESGEPLLTTNASEDFAENKSIISNALLSILCVPLNLKDTVTGVIYIDNRIRKGLFGEKELRLLTAFANQAAVAIENARLYEALRASLDEITSMRDLLDNVFASIASGVITTDNKNCVTQVNDAASRILGLNSQASLGKRISEVWPVLHEETLEVIRSDNVEETLELDIEVDGRGMVNLSLKLNPLRDAHGETQGVTIVVDDLTELKQREAQLNVVRRYLPPAMVDNIQSIDKLGLGGERRLVTTIFIDVRSSNSFPQVQRAQDIMEMLNRHLTIAADAVTKQNGVIDKYMANEIMGLFNSQLNPAEDHAWHAVMAALNMADDFAEFYKQIGEPDGAIYYRVGIHTGEATCGNVGGEHRREFTAIGDAINLAHRLLENALPGQIVVSEETLSYCRDLLGDPAQRIHILGHEHLQVKGRREVAAVCRLVRLPKA